MKEEKNFIPEEKVEFDDSTEKEVTDAKERRKKSIITAAGTLIIVLAVCLAFLLFPKSHNIAILRDGAGIHFNGVGAGESLHFMAIITIDDYNKYSAKQDFKTGIIYIETASLTGELTLSTPNVTDFETTSNWDDYEADKNNKYASLLIQITETNYKTLISVRSYVTVEGKTYYSDYNADRNSRSAHFIARKLQNDPAEYDKLTDEQKAIIDKYAK